MQYHPSLLPSQGFLRCPSGSPVPSLTTPHWVSVPTPPIMTSVPAPSTGQLHSPRGHETLHRYHEVQWEFPSEQAESGKCLGQGPRARSSRPEGNPPPPPRFSDTHQPKGGAPPRLPRVASWEARLSVTPHGQACGEMARLVQAQIGAPSTSRWLGERTWP